MENLLFLAHRIPYPPNKGDKIRSYHFLKHLVEGHSVFLGTFIDDPNDFQYVDKIKQLCKESYVEPLTPLLSKFKSLRGLLSDEALSLPYYRSGAMQRWVDETISKHSINNVLIFSSAMGQYIKTDHAVSMVVDFVDVDSDKWRQYASSKTGLSKWVYQREGKKLLAYEQQLADKAKLNFFVSEQEAELFKSLAPKAAHKTTHVNNGVDTEFFSPQHAFLSPYQEQGERLVFTGAMDYWANVDAVKWFAESVMPRLTSSFPALKFYIVGSKPGKEVKDLANNKNVVVTGAVEDVRPYIAHATMSVAPLRIARGIQNKVLEAMAMGKYVIATSSAMEGISYPSDASISVADKAEDMAEKIAVVLNSGSSTLVTNTNRQFVQTNFSWQQNVQRLSQMLKA